MHRFLLILIALVLATAATPPQGGSGSLFRKRQTQAQYQDQVSNYFSQHRWAKGKELLDEGQELYPNDAVLHYLAGRYWWNGKNWDKARYHLVKACQINYHYVDAKSLLLNVEEISGNYSSAICYVNELLEVNPYWKGLWLRKVDLYKKMGNFEEANILLKRLSQIYPNDASINSDYYDVLETTYQQARLSGDLNSAQDALSEIVRLNPTDADFQLAYANTLIRQGKMSDALESLTAALNANPGNVPIIKKTTDILMETGRSSNAISLVRTQMARNQSPELQRLYNTLLAESARIENSADPYELYPRTWNREHSLEALQYLLNQSIRRGYYDDALLYIEEMRRRQGDSPRWTMLDYEVYTRMGRHESAAKALEDGIAKFPDDYDINLNVSSTRLKAASADIAEERYAQAIGPLEFVRQHSVDPDLRATAVRRLALCYRETGDFQKAELMLRERLKTEPEYLVTIDYASLLDKQGRKEQAMKALQASYLDATDTLARKVLGNAYKETAYPYLKEKLAAGQTQGLQPITDMILQIDPDDYWGLRYSLRTAEDPLQYAQRGMEAYPDDPTFSVKAASIMAENGHHREALELLDSYLEDFPGDMDLRNTYAGISDTYALRLMKDKDYGTAAAVLDSALVLTPDNKEVRYTRGLVYEKQHQWDSAYIYLRYYQPSALEEKEYIARMNAIRTRTYRNSADIGIDLYRYTDSDHLMAIATAGYSHAWKKDAMQVRVNYSGRDYSVDTDTGEYSSTGGSGIQLMGAYTHEFGSWVTLNVQGGWSNKFFPKWVADVGATVHLPYDIDLDMGANLRYFQDGGNLNGLTAKVSHSWKNMYASAKFATGALYKIMYFNTAGSFRFYPIEGGRSYVEAMAGVGTAPELTFLTYYVLPSEYKHLNTFAALTASWAINHNMAMQLSGTLNTLYKQQQPEGIVLYRNLFIAHVSFQVYF